MQKIKLLLLNVKRLNFRTAFLNYFSNGTRNQNLILCFGRFKLSIKKSAEINLQNGFLFLNKPMRAKEPFVGMLEMNENSSINVENAFTIQSGCHIVLLEKAKLNLGSGYINRNVKIRCYKEITIGAVSYTHLDVYKRQLMVILIWNTISRNFAHSWTETIIELSQNIILKDC